MRTKLTPKEVRAIAMDGGEGWLVLADLAHEYGNEELARAAENSFDRTTGTNLPSYAGERMFRSLGAKGAITVAVRAARRALEREKSAGVDTDKRYSAAVEAVEAGVRGEAILSVLDTARSAQQREYGELFLSDPTRAAAYYAARAAYYYGNTARAAHFAAAGASFAVGSAGNAKEELTFQLADIFEVWWKYACRRASY